MQFNNNMANRIKNYRDTPFAVMTRQRLGMRAFWLFLYYFVASKLPGSPLPGSGFGMWLRCLCVRHIFKRVGRDVTVHSSVSFGSGVDVVIGDFSSLNATCSISNDTVIGNDVMMGPSVLVLSGSHDFTRTDISMREQGALPRRPVVIGDDVWIGARCILLPGVKVGSHSIIGSGSVVTKNVPEWTIVGGNPARAIRHRLDA